MADLKYKRYEKSLGLLTTKFVCLLQKAKDGVLDLKTVSILILVSIPLVCQVALLITKNEEFQIAWYNFILFAGDKFTGCPSKAKNLWYY